MQAELGSLFGVQFKRPVQVVIPDTEENPLIPEVDPNHHFLPEQVKKVYAWDKGLIGHSLMLLGPTGSGKSSLIEQYAARMRRKVYRADCHGRMEMTDLIGSKTLVNGNMQWVDGPLIRAMREGAIFVAEEVNSLHPSSFIGMHAIMEGKPYEIVDTGEWVKPAPGFRFAATGNAVNDGDGRSADHKGTQRQNIATLNRFVFIKVDYIPKMVEAKIIHAKAKALSGEIIEVMVKTAEDCRAAYLAGDVAMPISTRAIIRWGQLIQAFSGTAQGEELLEVLKETLNFAALDAASEDDREAIHKMVTLHFAA